MKDREQTKKERTMLILIGEKGEGGIYKVVYKKEKKKVNPVQGVYFKEREPYALSGSS